MIYYKLEPRFHVKTGAPIEAALVFAGYICDYTGNKIECEYSEDLPITTLKQEFSDSIEPEYDEDDEAYHFSNDLGIEYGSLFESSFHYAKRDENRFDGGDESLNLIFEWADHRQKVEGIFSSCASIPEAMRYARVRVVLRLLAEGMTLEELGLEKR